MALSCYAEYVYVNAHIFGMFSAVFIIVAVSGATGVRTGYRTTLAGHSVPANGHGQRHSGSVH